MMVWESQVGSPNMQKGDLGPAGVCSCSPRAVISCALRSQKLMSSHSLGTLGL